MSLHVRTTPEPIQEISEKENLPAAVSPPAVEAHASAQELPGAVMQFEDNTENEKQVLSIKPCEDAELRSGQSSNSKEMDPVPDKAAVRVFAVSLPVRIGGALLALCAGMVNAIAFHALSAFVSHQTGTLSKVALGLEDGEKADPAYSLALLLSFVVGSTVCGCFIGHNTVHFGLALYDFGLISICALLLAATFLSDKKLASCFAACACGLQNGLATSWGGAVIRTTHVTGLLTDVGLLLGRVLSIIARKGCGKNLDAFDQVTVADDLSKLSVLLSIGIAFFVGVFLGACLHNGMKRLAFLIPAGITGTVGIIYAVYRVFVLHQSFFTVAEMEIVDMPEQGLSDVCINVRSTSKRSQSECTPISPIEGDEGRPVVPALSADLQLLPPGSAGSFNESTVRRTSKNSRSFTPDHNVVSVDRAVLLAGQMSREHSKEPTMTPPLGLHNGVGA
mmetsp:Transcript_60914/g.108301  ORF Transcript_60914/g.108301 Transcript_60914/m.108301 type:complete len:449 (+) Transcript_60914:99-1445(+)